MQFYFGLTVFLLSSVCSRSEICKEDIMKDCLGTLQDFMEKEYLLTGEEFNEHCIKFQSEGNCLKNVPDVCQKEHRRKAELSASLYTHLTHQCSSRTEKLKNDKAVLPCIEHHKSHFEKCSGENATITKEDIQITYVCWIMRSMLCIAKTSRELCGKDGKCFAESVEYGLKDSYVKFCNGIGPFKFDYCVLLLSALILLVSKKILK